jgi:hypothetical protein
MSGRVDFGCGGVWAARHGRFGQEDWGQKDLVERTAFRICIGMGIAARGRDEHHHHHHLGYPISSGSSVLSFLFGSLGSSFVHSLHQSAVSSAPRSFLTVGLNQASRQIGSIDGLRLDWWCVCVSARTSPGLCLLACSGYPPPSIHRHTISIPTVPSQHQSLSPDSSEARSSTDRLARQDKNTSTGWDTRDTRDSNGVARTRIWMDGDEWTWTWMRAWEEQTTDGSLRPAREGEREETSTSNDLAR